MQIFPFKAAIVVLYATIRITLTEAISNNHEITLNSKYDVTCNAAKEATVTAVSGNVNAHQEI